MSYRFMNDLSIWRHLCHTHSSRPAPSPPLSPRFLSLLPLLALSFFPLFFCSSLLIPPLEVGPLNSVVSSTSRSGQIPAAKQFLEHVKSKSAHSVDYNLSNSFTLRSI